LARETGSVSDDDPILDFDGAAALRRAGEGGVALGGGTGAAIPSRVIDWLSWRQ
jgi:hypothetical protein